MSISYFKIIGALIISASFFSINKERLKKLNDNFIIHQLKIL